MCTYGLFYRPLYVLVLHSYFNLCDCVLFYRPLGTLNYLHIWHDNSGKGPFASWYLRSVVVRDVQTDEKFIFICNRWFAVEEDDGQVFVTIWRITMHVLPV